MKNNLITPVIAVVGSVLGIFVIGLYVGMSSIRPNTSAYAKQPTFKQEFKTVAVANAVLYDVNGSKVGRARLREFNGKVVMDARVASMTAGLHGIHIHTVGKCEAPAFTTAGGHFNPDAKQHGLDNPNGSHAGDLPNITVNDNGRGFTSVQTQLTSIASLLDADGAAIVVHAGQDDEVTDPSGNSGARIACGVWTLVDMPHDNYDNDPDPIGVPVPCVSPVEISKIPVTVNPSYAYPSISISPRKKVDITMYPGQETTPAPTSVNTQSPQ